MIQIKNKKIVTNTEFLYFAYDRANAKYISGWHKFIKDKGFSLSKVAFQSNVDGIFESRNLNHKEFSVAQRRNL